MSPEGGKRMARIMVIDDQEELRALLRSYLEAAGHVVTEASNGIAALVAFDELIFELIITDVFMPEEDGIVVARLAHELQPDAKLLAISGGGSDLSPDWALEMVQTLGADAVLAKPIEKHEFLNTVHALLVQ